MIKHAKKICSLFINTNITTTNLSCHLLSLESLSSASSCVQLFMHAIIILSFMQAIIILSLLLIFCCQGRVICLVTSSIVLWNLSSLLSWLAGSHKIEVCSVWILVWNPPLCHVFWCLTGCCWAGELWQFNNLCAHGLSWDWDYFCVLPSLTGQHTLPTIGGVVTGKSVASLSPRSSSICSKDSDLLALTPEFLRFCTQVL